MAVERERGISVSSAVMSFEHQGLASNLLDTPGVRPVVAIAAGSILLCYRSG
jgi:peptide subunit release factor RF-3